MIHPSLLFLSLAQRWTNAYCQLVSIKFPSTGRLAIAMRGPSALALFFKNLKEAIHYLYQLHRPSPINRHSNVYTAQYIQYLASEPNPANSLNELKLKMTRPDPTCNARYVTRCVTHSTFNLLNMDTSWSPR
jgi:hypothetical protein